MPTDTQFQDLIKGLAGFCTEFEQGNMRGAGAALRTWLDAVDPNDAIQPPAQTALPADPLPEQPAPVAPTPAPAAPLPYLDAATLVIQAAGLPAGEDQVRLLSAWITAESGAPAESILPQTNNPMNTTAPLNRQWSWTGQVGFWNDLHDGYGVATFDTLANGAAACAHVLNQPNMAAIKGALAGGDDDTFVLALRQDPWGTNADTVKAILAG